MKTLTATWCTHLILVCDFKASDRVGIFDLPREYDAHVIVKQQCVACESKVRLDGVQSSSALLVLGYTVSLVAFHSSAKPHGKFMLFLLFSSCCCENRGG